ncbi:MAG: hypothetical protein P1V81_05480 [Planctomycetota bacterium]|nr:hypothetical protein [Planctomycetota bacterium]
MLLLAALVLDPGAAVPTSSVPTAAAAEVRGMTISTRTMGSEWGGEGFEAELDRLQGLGVNWVAIHPYAGIRADGSVRFTKHDPADPPDYLARPIAAAHARGMRILIKPHLAYWGSPFAWRGEVHFEEAAADARFWSGLQAWTVNLAEVTRAADAFVVGTELELQVDREDEWRELIARVRAVTDAHLTYSANWDGVERVPFWDALDVIGVQAYFPLVADAGPGGIPSKADLRAAWEPHLARLEALSKRTGRDVFFAELGYDRSETTHLRPWVGAPRGSTPSAASAALQLRCLDVAFDVFEEEADWLHGGFLWKWFVPSSRRSSTSDFQLDHQPARDLLTRRWVTPER